MEMALKRFFKLQRGLLIVLGCGMLFMGCEGVPEEGSELEALSTDAGIFSEEQQHTSEPEVNAAENHSPVASSAAATATTSSEEDHSDRIGMLEIHFNTFDFNQYPSRILRINDNTLNSKHQVVIRAKDIDGALLACQLNEADCADGLRSYTADDLAYTSISFPAVMGQLVSIGMEITRDGILTYQTDGDLEVDSSEDEILSLAINLYPTGEASLDAGAVEKTIDFDMSVSDTTAAIINEQSISHLNGQLTCAESTGKAISDFPQNVYLSYDATTQSFYAENIALPKVHVGSPCQLSVAGTRLEGNSDFNVDSELAQTIDGFEFEHEKQFIITDLNVLNEGGSMSVELASALNDELLLFLNGNAATLSYEISVTQGSYNESATLSLVGEEFVGAISPYPPTDAVSEVTLTVYKNGKSWLTSTQNFQFDTGQPNLPNFAFKMKKKATGQVSTTRGNLLIQVVSGNKKVGSAKVTFTNTSTEESWTCTANNKGKLALAGTGKDDCSRGIPAGEYTMTIAKSGYITQETEITIVENVLVSKAYELEKE